MEQGNNLFIWSSQNTPKTHIGFTYPFCGGSKALFPKEEMISIFGEWCPRCLKIATRKGLIDWDEIREIALITPLCDGTIWIRSKKVG